MAEVFYSDSSMYMYVNRCTCGSLLVKRQSHGSTSLPTPISFGLQLVFGATR